MMRVNYSPGGLRRSARPGMTLLEVLLALAIFLFALVAISQMFNSATDQAVDVQWQSRGTRLAQSKLGEYAGGVLNLTSSSSGSFEEEPDWEWTSDVTSDGTAVGLYRVTVTVHRETNRGRVETKLSQYILDPRSRGSIGTTTTTVDSATTTTTDSSSTTTTGSTTTTPPTTGTGSTGGGTTGSTGGGATGGGNTGGGNTGGGTGGVGNTGSGTGGGATGGTKGGGR